MIDTAAAVALAASAVTVVVMFIATAAAYVIGKKVAGADCVQLKVTNRELMHRRRSLLNRLDEIAHEANVMSVDSSLPESVRIKLQQFTAINDAQKEVYLP